MKNHQVDLNNHLFTTLERLNEEGVAPEAMKLEIERAKAVADVSRQMIDNMRLVLEVEVAKAKHDIETMPKIIQNELEHKPS